MNRVIIHVGEKVLLHSGTQFRTFVIINAGDDRDGKWYKQGASAICFDAAYTDEAGLNHYGKLKKFYLSDESRDFETEAGEYISSYKRLHEIVSAEKSMSQIYSFIPEFEVYYDDNGCPYIWTNNVPMLTFEEMCGRLLIGEERTEEVLSEITATLRTATDCIRILHENGLIHGDITPSNFGFYMRDNKILTDSVKFFDLNTLRYVSQRPKWYTPPYYEKPSSDAEQGNRADIRAIGITLCKALGMSDDQVEDIKNARKTYLSNRKTRDAVSRILFSADLFKFKGIPEDENVREQLVTLVAGTVTNTHSRIISSCTKLYRQLRLLETYLLPYCTGDELGRGLGIEIVNKELRRRDKVREVFRYLLYHRPLYQWQDGKKSGTYGVVLFGFGLDSQNFLDVCLETAQSMDQEIEVDIWGTSRIEREKDYYLKKRPALSQFFSVDGQDEKLTGDFYGKIHFHIREEESLDRQIETIVSSCGNLRYVYIAAGNDKENSEIAEIFSALLKDKNVSVNAQCERKTKDKNGVHYVCVENELTKNADHEDIERMSFNTFLIWSGTLNADLKIKRETYEADYYHASCFSNVLSVKYKLHSFGIEMSDGVYHAANALRVKLAENSGIRKKMAAAEHRRWVTEKLCDGWINMTVEDSLQYNDTKDIQGKRHICILRSSEKNGRPAEWSNPDKWDDEEETNWLKQLDELDRMSVELHRAYRRYADNSGLDFAFAERTMKEIFDGLEGMDAVRRTFLEWSEWIGKFYDGFLTPEPGSKLEKWNIAEYEMLYSRLLKETDEGYTGGKLGKQAVKNKINAVYTSFLPVSRCLKYHDYKKNDEDLINNIPFILTYTEDITMVVPVDYPVLICEWDDVRPTELFSYVAAATVVNPGKLYLPYLSPAKEKQETVNLIFQKEQAMIDYIKRKGLQTEVSFIRLEDKSDLRTILRISGHEKRNGWLLVENNGTDIVAVDDMEQIYPFSASYAFDMKKIKFDVSGDAEWLKDIQRNVGITVRDVAEFLGRKMEIKEQPFFHRIDSRILFGIYRANRIAWRDICGLLKTSGNKNIDIAKFKKTCRDEAKEPERHIYFMPYTCFQSVCRILRLMKDADIIDDQSYIFRYSTNACKAVIYENSGCGEELRKLFMKHDLLIAAYNYRLNETDEKITLRCDGLSIKEIPFDFQENDRTKNMRSLFERLQSAGFITLKIKKKSFDIVYGSRQIKEIFMEQGNLLELYTYCKAKELNTFDDVVTGVGFFRGADRNRENEIDCFVTKGFQTVIIECKARTLKRGIKSQEELIKMKKELRNKVRKYGINGSGLLIVDSETEIPKVQDYDEITVCSEIQEIANIGKAVYEQIKKSEDQI